MDPYNLLQEQLATLNNNLNNSLSKIHEEVVNLSKRVESLENNNNNAASEINSKVNEIDKKVNILPKIYSNQINNLESQLHLHQYHLKSVSNLIQKDAENSPFLSTGGSLVTTATNSAGSNNNASNSASGGISSSNRVNSPNLLNPVNQAGRINASNRVNHAGAVNHIIRQQQQQVQQQHARRSAASRTFVNSNIVPLEHEQTIGAIPSSVIQQSSDSSGHLGDEVDESDHILQESGQVPFRRLNPSPTCVQDVLDEYYYGYQGQPPLKYLEEHQKKWRKGNKNLSKTFSRRYRVVTAVEIGVQMYSDEFGGNESLAKERVINELENLRGKESGGKETMYWLFHHIPEHLKKKR